MRTLAEACCVVCLALFVGCGGSDKGANAPGAAPTTPPPPPGPPGCGLAQAAFCDTFDAASPGGRAGDLDDANWSVARISTMGSREVAEPWRPTTAFGCGETKTNVIPDQDIFFCAGGGTPSMHMNDVQDDDGGFTIHSYRIRKPFDFTNRTGIISFDVAGKARMPGGHGFWFNLVIADEPVPAPYQQGGQIALFTKAGLVIEFEAGGISQECPADGTSNSVSTIYVEKDYRIANTYQYLVDRNPTKGCFKTAEEVMNHIEVHISQTSVEVFASDINDPGSLRSITKVDDKSDGVSLPLTRGYVNLQHSHYNAKKSGELDAWTTYHWDNVAFDGPSFQTPRSYEVPDSLESYMLFGTDPMTNVGYNLTTTGLVNRSGPVPPVTLPGVDLTNAADASITLNAWFFCPGESLGYRLNGGDWRNYDCPFPLACDGCGDGNAAPGTCDPAARAVNIPVQLSDLKQGDNTLELKTSHPQPNDVIVANIELTVNPTQ